MLFRNQTIRSIKQFLKDEKIPDNFLLVLGLKQEQKSPFCAVTSCNNPNELALSIISTGKLRK